MKLAIKAAIFAFACAALAAQAQDRVIRIGVAMPISGPGSYFGVMGKEGIDLALEQFKGGVNGYRLQVQYEDSACSPLQATNAVKRVLDQFRPHIVIGEECSDASLAIAPILEQAKVPQLNAGSVTMKLTESGYKYVFRIFPSAEQQGPPLARNAYDKLKARNAVLLYEKTNAGQDSADGFEKFFVAAGGKIVARIDFGRDLN
ncbi:MAG: amino acid ABC transporter substrate-binding protein, partial [Betaproteobacteria bacterium]